MQFDPNSPITIRIELAKSNSKTKRLVNSDSHVGYRGPLSSWPSNSNGTMGAIPPFFQGRLRPGSGRTPCSTLFVANLDPKITEAELIRLFGPTPGYKRLKFHNKDEGPICFVEYQDVTYSTNCMSMLNGFPFGSSPLRIEYAKNKMGESFNGRRKREPSNRKQDKDSFNNTNTKDNFNDNKSTTTTNTANTTTSNDTNTDASDDNNDQDDEGEDGGEYIENLLS